MYSSCCLTDHTLGMYITRMSVCTRTALCFYLFPFILQVVAAKKILLHLSYAGPEAHSCRCWKNYSDNNCKALTFFRVCLLCLRYYFCIIMIIVRSEMGVHSTAVLEKTQETSAKRPRSRPAPTPPPRGFLYCD